MERKKSQAVKRSKRRQDYEKRGVSALEAKLHVQMLGGFSIRMGEKEIGEQESRSWKVWLLLVYLICNRNRIVSVEELTTLLWRDDERSVNPQNALKTVFHRGRTMLDQLYSHAGHQLLHHRDGTYAWNPEVPLHLDVEAFTMQCQLADAAADEETLLEACQQAVTLYAGDFLPRLSEDPWVMAYSAGLHDRYLDVVQRTLPLLEKQSRLDEAVALCRKTMALDPLCEGVYRHLLQDLLRQGNRESAAKTYEEMRQRLFDSYGLLPSADVQALYRKAVQVNNDQIISLDKVKEQLRETSQMSGALICDYDYFKIIYQSVARSILRDGIVAHLCLVSVSGRDDRPLSRRSLDLCMKNLQSLIRKSLRRGDTVSQCSVSQYVLLLPHASYENSAKVCQRVLKAFSRQYPHSPATLHYDVQPVDPYRLNS